MRKARLLVLLMLIFSLPLSAQIDFFAGAQADLAFPATYQGDELIGFGGGGTIEGGIYLGDLSLGIVFNVINSNDKGSLVNQMTDFKIGAQAGYDFGNELISFLPDWLCIRPNLALFADIYTAEGYRSKSKKGADRDEKSGGCAFAFETGLCLDFPNLLTYNQFDFIPTLGYFETFCLEEKGMIFSGRISIGMRVIYSPNRS